MAKLRSAIALARSRMTILCGRGDFLTTAFAGMTKRDRSPLYHRVRELAAFDDITRGLVYGALCFVLLVPPLPAHAFDHATIARRALENHILPGYGRFREASAKLQRQTEVLCVGPSPVALKHARAAFREALLSWGRIEHIRFGPIAEEKRHDRMLFWPDRKGLARRQVEKLLAEGRPDDFSWQALAGKSVAVQGFSAFDIVAFGMGAEDLAKEGRAPFARCRFALAIAANIATVAEAVLAAWRAPGGYRAVWLAPGPGNPAYLNEKEPTRALARAFIDGLEQTRDLRLAGPLGFKDQKLRPLDPPLPNSRVAVPLIAANIEGARALLSECGFLDRALVASAGTGGDETAAVLATIASELDRAANAAKSVEGLAREPFNDARAKEKLASIGFPLKNARQTGGAYLSEAAGLGIGFNAGDGD